MFNNDLFFNFINKCWKEIQRCVPPSSHVCDFLKIFLFTYILEDSSISDKSCGALAFAKASLICLFFLVHIIWTSFWLPFHVGMICLLSITSPEFAWCYAQNHGGFSWRLVRSHLMNFCLHGLIWIVIWYKMLHHTHLIMLMFLLLVWT